MLHHQLLGDRIVGFRHPVSAILVDESIQGVDVLDAHPVHLALGDVQFSTVIAGYISIELLATLVYTRPPNIKELDCPNLTGKHAVVPLEQGDGFIDTRI